MQAAAYILESRGLAGTTTNHIATRAGVNVGSLYQYFPNKDAIIVALIERETGRFAAMLKNIAAHARTPEGARLTVREGVAFIVDAHLEHFRSRRRLLKLLFEQLPRVGLQDLIRSQRDGASLLLANYLRSNEKDLRQGVDVDSAAVMVVLSIEMCCMAVIAGEPIAKNFARFRLLAIDMCQRLLFP